MSLRRLQAAFCILLVASAAHQIPAQQSELSGKISSSEGAPIAGATVLLRCAEDGRKDARTVSAKDGSYHFITLLPCNYALTVEAAGFTSTSRALIDLGDKASSTVRQDVMLSRDADGTSSASRPSFQAAGIHGLIDPGGYSASASSGAATSVLEDFSGMQSVHFAKDPTDLVESCQALDERIRLAQRHPGDWQASAAAGKSLLAVNQSSEAANFLSRADQLAPAAAADVRLDLAESLISLGRFQQALKTLDSMAGKSDISREHSLRAQAEQGIGDFDVAVQERDAAVQKAPTEQNISALGYTNLLAGHVDQADAVYRSGLNRYPQSIALLIGVGAVDFFEHRFASAQEHILQAARLSPQDRRPYPLLSDIDRVSGSDGQDVYEAIEHHLAVDANDPTANAALGSFLLHHNGAPKAPALEKSLSAIQTAEQSLKRALRLDPNLTQARSDLALLYHREGRFDQEAEELSRLSREAPSRDVEYRLGLAYRSNGQSQAAETALKSARDLQDSTSAAITHLQSLTSVGPTDSRRCPSATRFPITPTN